MRESGKDMENTYNLLIDTNIFLDVLEKREPFFKDSYKVMELCRTRKIRGYISIKSACDIYYIVHKKTHSSAKAYEAIGYINKLVPYVPMLGVDILKACDMKWNDFEDCLLYVSAKASGLNGIVTRNTRDFEKADIRVYEPEYFEKY